MEFFLDSENIQIKIKDEKMIDQGSILSSEGSIYQKITLMEPSEAKDNYVSSQLENENVFYGSSVLAEVVLRLDEFYLINNLKIQISKLYDNEIKINKIKFQNVDTHLWDWAYFYNPDNKEIISRTEDSISIFCVGLTDYIKFHFLLRLTEDNDHAAIIKNFKQKLSKIIVYSQYIYSIPNATFLMTLLNLKNFFQNFKTNDPTLEQSKSNNYFCSLYLTASSMIQARLFIQAWELLSTMQTFILTQKEKVNNNFFKILFEVQNFDNYNSESQLITNESHSSPETYIFVTKIELIKAVCMFEHGHLYIFLNCLKNCINIYNNHDYSGLNKGVSLTKINEIYSDKFNIQNFLQKNGEKLSDVLILFLKDKNENLKFSILKVFEFIIDYNPSIIFKHLSKIIKFLFKTSYRSKSQTGVNQQVSAGGFGENSLIEQLKKNKLFVPSETYSNYNSTGKGPNSSAAVEKGCKSESSKGKNGISQILQKQIHYTLDTIINNLETFSGNIISLITNKTNMLLFDVLYHTEKEDIIHVTAIKFLRKCYENIHSNILSIKNIGEFIFGLFLRAVKPSVKTIYKDYLNIQNKISKISQPQNKNSKEMKEIIQNTNCKNNLINSLLNENGLIESGNENGSLFVLIFDKVGEELINSQKSEEILAWVNQNLNFLISFIENQGTNQSELDFCIFYIFLFLEFLSIIFYSNSKIEINKAIYKLNLVYRKQNKNFEKILTDLIDILFRIENFTLSNRKSYILFEISLDILGKIKFIYSTETPLPSKNIFNYNSYLVKQYSALNAFVQDNGIFTDNIKFILKTLSLCDITDDSLSRPLKSILNLFLQNFTNYYTEETFQLFTLLVERFGSEKLIDKPLFNKLTQAIVNKSNYKGTTFKQCYSVYFEIITKNSEYFSFFKENIKENFEVIIEKTEKFNGDKLKFKESYLEFLDRIELYRKFYEYLSSFPLPKEERKKFYLLSEAEMKTLLVKIVKVSDDTIINKLNTFFDSLFNLFDCEGELYQELSDDLISQSETICSVFEIINKKENLYLIFENAKLMSKILSLINKQPSPKTENEAAAKNSTEKKIKIFLKFFSTIDFKQISNVSIKFINDAVMNFFENLILDLSRYLEFANSNPSEAQLAKEYSNMLLKILSFYFDSSDEIQVFFGIEILLKIFNIRIQEDVNVKEIKEKINELNKNNELIWLNMIWEKIIKLSISQQNYKISIFANFVLQLIVPTNHHAIVEPIITLKVNDTETCVSNFWLSDDEIQKMHNFIREKIIVGYKNQKEICEKDYYEMFENESEDDFNKQIKVDEINDDEDEDEPLPENYQYTNENALNYQNSINITNTVNSNLSQIPPQNFVNTVQIQKIGQILKEEEDNLSLDDLGVPEVEDEVFENFDEENIPVLKTSCVRAKGFAAKLRTNQTSRTLLMSEHVQNYSRNNNAPCDGDLEEKQNADADADADNNEEFCDVPDLTTKKSKFTLFNPLENIRPLNGFRPATPPLRNNNPSTNQTSKGGNKTRGQNFDNPTNVNAIINPDSYVPRQNFDYDEYEISKAQINQALQIQKMQQQLQKNPNKNEIHIEEYLNEDEKIQNEESNEEEEEDEEDKYVLSSSSKSNNSEPEKPQDQKSMRVQIQNNRYKSEEPQRSHEGLQEPAQNEYARVHHYSDCEPEEADIEEEVVRGKNDEEEFYQGICSPRNSHSREIRLNRCKSDDVIDKKFDIQSMEDLFIDPSINTPTLNEIAQLPSKSSSSKGKKMIVPRYSSAVSSNGKHQSKFQGKGLNLNLGLVDNHSIGSTSANGSKGKKVMVSSSSAKKHNNGKQINFDDDFQINSNFEYDFTSIAKKNQTLSPGNPKLNSQHPLSVSPNRKYLESETNEVQGEKDNALEDKKKTRASMNEKRQKGPLMNQTFTFSSVPNEEINNMVAQQNGFSRAGPQDSTKSPITGLNKRRKGKPVSSNPKHDTSYDVSCRKEHKAAHNPYYKYGIIDDFRNTIKQKINQNPSKIINNLKKFSAGGNTSRQGGKEKRAFSTIQEEDMVVIEREEDKKKMNNTLKQIQTNNFFEEKTSVTTNNTPNFSQLKQEKKTK